MFLLLLWNHFLVVQYLTTAGGSQIPQYLKGKGRKGGGMEEGSFKCSIASPDSRCSRQLCLTSVKLSCGCPVPPWTVPPRKWSPRTIHGRIISPPRPNIAAIPGPPVLPTVSLLLTAACSQLPLPQHLHMENSLDTACSIKTR